MPLFPRLTSHSAEWQGLDYLNVTYTNSSVSVDAANTTVPIHVAVTLRNTVAMAGQYVVQVYFTPPVSRRTRLTRYRFMLGGFAKVHVPASGSASCVVDVPRTNLQHWNPKAAEHVLDSGGYTLYVCHDSRGLGGARGGAPTGKQMGSIEGLGHDQACLAHGVEL